MKHITKDFTWEEMLRSETADKASICNQPGHEERQAIEELVKRVLQPLRLAYGKPIVISSGYRCPELNKKVGGVPSSQHVKGQAADCVIRGLASKLLGILLAENLPFDQAILYKKRNFLHISLRPDKNRKQVIVNN